jgi:type VI secretion system protein ImpE
MQLDVVAELDAGNLPLARTYQAAIQCEKLRMSIFRGERAPLIFGEPETWVALLVQALSLLGQGLVAESAEVRGAAFDQAPAVTGSINGTGFQWIADSDSRLGPVLEVVINGRYGWLPFVHLRRLSIEPVADLRDLVWIPAQLTFVNDADTVALVPVRYAGTTLGGDTALLMSRKTEWLKIADDQYRGLGQRVLATDGGDHALLDVREIVTTATGSSS